jgi:uncharacterized protein (DUF2267 family)
VRRKALRVAARAVEERINAGRADHAGASLPSPTRRLLRAQRNRMGHCLPRDTDETPSAFAARVQREAD